MRIHNFLAFSPDGKRIVLASSDKTVYIWDVETKKEIRRLEGHTDRVNSAAFSPDGKQIVTASTDDTARIWDAETGKEVSCLVGHTGSVYSAAFSPNGKGSFPHLMIRPCVYGMHNPERRSANSKDIPIM